MNRYTQGTIPYKVAEKILKSLGITLLTEQGWEPGWNVVFDWDNITYSDILALICFHSLLDQHKSPRKIGYKQSLIAFEGYGDTSLLGERPIQSYLEEHDYKVFFLVMSMKPYVSAFPANSLERRLADFAKGTFRHHTDKFCLIDVQYWVNYMDTREDWQG